MVYVFHSSDKLAQRDLYAKFSTCYARVICVSRPNILNFNAIMITQGLFSTDTPTS